MESLICPGLFFSGEVLDVDGITGGFNFQHCWTSGWLAGNAIANSIIVSTKNDIPNPTDIAKIAIINVRLVCLASFPATASVRIREIPNTKKSISTSTIVIVRSLRNAG